MLQWYLKNYYYMKILIIGGNGTIGKKVAASLSQKHQTIIASRTKGDVLVDITDSNSIKKMFEKTGNVDAVVCIAGAVKWAPFNDLSEEDFYIGIQSKMMGQVNLTRIGRHYINTGGSISLTTGILADDPVNMTTGAALVNGGLNSFVKAAAMEIGNSIRVNAVSPGLVEDSVSKFGNLFPGHNPVAMNKVVNGYLKSVEGKLSGEVIRIY